MSSVIDTVVTSAVNPGAGPATFLPGGSGDSTVVRNFNPPDTAKLVGITRRGATAGFARVRSTLLHDPTRGIMFTTGQTPSLWSIPQEVAELLQAQDALIVEGSGGAAETDVIALHILYSNLPGGGGRLFMPGDVYPLISHIKPITVAVTSSATIGNWSDTVITTTEDLTKANTDYAVLGYVTNVALGVVAIRGADTGNFRVGGPGSINIEDTSDYFITMSNFHGVPYVPVFNAANKGSTFVSVVDSAASTAATITLICGQLSRPLPAAA